VDRPSRTERTVLLDTGQDAGANVSADAHALRRNRGNGPHIARADRILDINPKADSNA
jgi:hypothetical protein